MKGRWKIIEETDFYGHKIYYIYRKQLWWWNRYDYDFSLKGAIDTINKVNFKPKKVLVWDSKTIN